MTNVVDAGIVPMVVPADNVGNVAQGQWNYAAYAALLDDGNRYEIIDGVLYMPPAPGASHQESNGLFTHYLVIHVRLAGLGRVFPAPFDVELPSGDVVQPDVTVILNTNQNVTVGQRAIGTPDLVVEISSPGTVGYDRGAKQNAYAQASIAEYWIADPATRTVEVLILNQTKYRSAGVFQGQATLPSQVLSNFPVKVEEFFA